MKQANSLTKYEYQINDTKGTVEAHNIRLATTKALYEYQNAWPERSQEEELTIKIKPK